MRKFVVVAVSIFAAVFATQAQALEQTLTAPSPVTNESLGRSVAVEGSTLVVGIPGADSSRGAVLVYKRSGDTWTFNAKLTASDGVGGGDADLLGSSVAIDGDRIIAGAPFDNNGATLNQGSAYIFTTDGAAARSELAKVVASDGATEDRFGSSVAIDGDTIVVGAPQVSNPTPTEGAVYTFARTGGAQTAKLTTSGSEIGTRLGTSVAIDGSTIVAGATGYSTTAAASGAAFLFARTGADRSETAELRASNAVANARIGSSVAIEGGTVVVGADAQTVDGNGNEGSAYTFNTTGSSPRTQTAILTASDGASDSRIGASVAIDGSRIIVGGFGEIGGGVPSGSAYEFASTGGNRTETRKLVQTGGQGTDQFGASVSVDGTTIAVGAPTDDLTGGTNQGSATVFFDAAPVPPVDPPVDPPAGDTTPPQTSAIAGKTKFKAGKTAKFTFSSNESGSTFECRLGSAPFKSCSSPFSVKTKKLKGKQTLEVRAIDAAGNKDASPSSLKFTVKKKKKKK